MSEVDLFVGQVVFVVEEIPENGVGVVEVSDHGKRVPLPAQSDTHLVVHKGSRVVVQQMVDEQTAVVSVNLPTPC